MSRQDLSKVQLLAYASVSVPLQALINPILIFLPSFYASEIGLDIAAVGIVFFLARAADSFTDPIVGGLSDRTNASMGRRRPWLLFGTPFLMAFSYLALVPTENPSLLSLGLIVFLFNVSWTTIFIPYQSWGAEISSEYTQRTRIAVYREGGTVLGVILGIGIPLILIDPFTAPIRAALALDAFGLDNSLGHVLKVTALSAFLLPLAVAAACWTMPEIERNSQRKITWRQSLSVLKRNRIFLRLFVGYSIAQLGFFIFLSAVQLLITRALEIDQFLFLIFAQQVVAILSLPFWMRAADRYGKHRVFCLSLAIIVIGLLSLNLVEPGDFGGALLVFLFCGLGTSGKLILPPSLAADTVDYDTMVTGSREAGTHIALLSIANKVPFALSVGISFPLLAASGFDATGPNSPEAIQSLQLIGTVLPATALLVSMLFMWNFPLGRDRHASVIRALRRKQGLAAK